MELYCRGLLQHHELLDLLKFPLIGAMCVEAVEINPRAESGSIQSEDVGPCRKFFIIRKHGNFPANEIVNLQGNRRVDGQVEPDGGRQIERIRIILPERELPG